MFTSTKSFSQVGRAVAAALAISVLAAPSALAVTDLRSPDVRDVASPRPVTPSLVIADRRSPDARDAATPSRRPVVVTPATSGTAAAADAFEWGDAAIGAATVVALMALGSASMGLVGRRRQHVHRPAATS
jgi:hypothetical protein